MCSPELVNQLLPLARVGAHRCTHTAPNASAGCSGTRRSGNPHRPGRSTGSSGYAGMQQVLGVGARTT